MELTKTQIQKIDNRLDRQGIVYWDLRTEMVDHIVSDIEENAQTNNFKLELERSLEKLGWDRDLYRVNQDGWENINKKYRKEFHTEIVTFFKHPKKITLLIFFCSAQYFLSKTIGFKIFNTYNYVLLFLPILMYLLFSFKFWMKKYGKSVNLEYGIFYLALPFSIFQAIPLFMKEASNENRILMWLLLIPFYYITSFAGYIICKKAITRVEKMKKELAL